LKPCYFRESTCAPVSSTRAQCPFPLTSIERKKHGLRGLVIADCGGYNFAGVFRCAFFANVYYAVVVAGFVSAVVVGGTFARSLRLARYPNQAQGIGKVESVTPLSAFKRLERRQTQRHKTLQNQRGETIHGCLGHFRAPGNAHWPQHKARQDATRESSPTT